MNYLFQKLKKNGCHGLRFRDKLWKTSFFFEKNLRANQHDLQDF